MNSKLALVALLAIGLMGGANAAFPSTENENFGDDGICSGISAMYCPPTPCPPTPIGGTVTDSCTGDPIAGVKVEVWKSEDMTDENGWYLVSGYGCGRKALKASKAGYKSFRRMVKLDGVPITRDIRLKPKGGCGEPEPYCGDEICGETEDCATCPSDCGECEPEPEVVRRGKSRNYIWVHSLPRYYDELVNGYWKRYADNCGIEYKSNTPPQNIRWACNQKHALESEPVVEERTLL